MLTLLAALILIVRGYIRRTRKELEEKVQTDIRHQLELVRACIATQENERARISANLHDDLLSQLRRLMLLSADNRMTELLQESIATTRTISHELMPPLLHTLGLDELIGDFMYPLSKEYTVSFHCACDKSIVLEKEIQLHLYRIFQEVVSNILVHAHAQGIGIKCRISAKLVYLSVSDDGIGGDFQKAQGLGLRNIELRAALIRGRYKIVHRVNQGTRFSLLLQNEHTG